MKRIIPILLLKDRLLYKTINFQSETYIGDPFVALKIFNEKEVDELVVLDINKSSIEPDFDFLNQLASEAFMPLSYGGGINCIDTAEKIFRIGFEKVVINSANINDFSLIESISSRFGNQSVVCCVDYNINFFGKRICTFNNGRNSINTKISDFIKKAIEAGSGEIMLQCINYEGKMEKMDIEFIKEVVKSCPVPVIGTGGASSYQYISDFFKKTNASAIAAGSIFVYHGPHNAVLINYPSFEKKNALLP